MNVLIISLAGIGDTLFATPLIHEIRASFPKATIDALVLWNGSKDLLEGNPHLDSVYQKNLIKAGKIQAIKFLWKLRKNRYECSINTHPQSRIHYRFVARLINAPVRLSHEYEHSTMVDRLLVNQTIPQDYQRHCIDNNLAFLPLLGAKQMLKQHDYELYLSPAEAAWADHFTISHKLSQRKLLGIHMGSGGTKNLALRRWPLDSYLELINRINQTRPETAILLFGGPEEQKDHDWILARAENNSVYRAHTQSLRHAVALVKKCHLFLSVDTALMHMAAAMKVPKQVVIETPTWNKPIEPYHNPFVLVKNPSVAGRNLDYYRYDGRGIRGTPHELLQCMASVSVEAVYQALFH